MAFNPLEEIGKTIGGGGVGRLWKEGYKKISGPDSKPNYGQSASDLAAQGSFDQAEKYQQKMAQEARGYRENLGGTRGALMNQAGDEGRRSLAGSLTDVRAQANRRGLLYSGLRDQDEQGAVKDFASGLSSQAVGINRETENNARQMEDEAKQAGISIQQGRQALADQIYESNLAKYGQAQKQQQDKKGVVGTLGGLIGSLGGMAAGKA